MDFVAIVQKGKKYRLIGFLEEKKKLDKTFNNPRSAKIGFSKLIKSPSPGKKGPQAEWSSHVISISDPYSIE